MADLLELVREAAAPFGLNLVAAIPVAHYHSTTRLEWDTGNARSIILIANGGGDFWRAFRAHSAAHPGWDRRENPLDDFTQSIIDSHILTTVRSSGVDCTPIYPFIASAPMLNFMELAQLSGLAGPSLLGVVVNPVFGPWIAFRAALLVDHDLDAPGPALGFDPCPTCTVRSCIPACPAGAISSPAGWDIPRCLIHRVEQEPDCAPRCHARAACVLGPEHRYPDDELAYHQMRALRAMRRYYDEKIRPTRAGLD